MQTISTLARRIYSWFSLSSLYFLSAVLGLILGILVIGAFAVYATAWLVFHLISWRL